MRDVGGHVILVGLEGLSVRTLEELRRLGEPVVVIAPAVADLRHRDAAAAIAQRIVEGDPRDAAVLERAGVSQAQALVLTSDDDVVNIHVALIATTAAPGLHVIVRTFDEEFARRVQSLIPGATALSASALAAPGFLSAILGAEDERTLDIAGRSFALRPAAPDDPATALILSDDRTEPPALLPDPSRLPPRQYLALVGLEDRPRQRIRGGRDPVRASRAGIRSALGRVDRRFWVLGAILSVITVGAAIIFESARGILPVEALYATVAGFFGAVNPDVAETEGLKAFSVVLTLVGAAALALFYGLIADVVLSARMRDLLGPRATDLRDHVVVVGLGSVGFRIARALREAGIPVVAAEQRAAGRFVEDARDLGIPVVIGDAGQPGLLRAVGIERARALAAVTDQDAANLATALHARSARDDLRIVVRLFDPELAARLEGALGAYHSRSVSALAAPAFAAAAVGRQVLATIPVGHRLVVVARVPVVAGSASDGSTVGAECAAAAAIPMGGARVLAVASGTAVTWRPPADHPVLAGDELLLVASRRSLAVSLGRASTPLGGASEPRQPAPPASLPA